MIFGERVKQARELHGLTQTRLAEQLGITQSSVAQIESGRLVPSDELLDVLSFQTSFPPSFFSQKPDDEFPLGSLLFRSKAATTSREEKRLYRHAQIGYRLITRLLAKAKPLELRLPRLENEIPDTAADVTRAAFGLSPDQPVSNLIDVLERSGVVVLALPVESSTVDAFSTWVGTTSERPLIAISRRQGDGARLRWSLAHEVGHLVLHRAIESDLAQVEAEANRFAGQFLLPDIAIREELISPVTLVSVAGLKPRWGVSMQALIMRALELEIITARQRKYLFQQLSMRGWRKREPENLDVALERPSSLPQLARLFYGDPIDFAGLARTCNFRASLVEDFVSAHRGDSEAETASV